MPAVASREPRRICFVTGTRAEFGLMHSVLTAIHADPLLRLQLVATGMHLDPSRGNSIDDIRATGWTVDRIIPWQNASQEAGAPSSQTQTSAATGTAMSLLATAFDELATEIVLVVGDRVEAFAAAAAAHIAGRVVAHVHGGDRAAGLVDDSLRHAITKLSHVHFPATAQSAERIRKLGEQRWRIHRVGSPGLDDMGSAVWWEALSDQFPTLRRRRYALLIYHPSSSDEEAEGRSAQQVLAATQSAGFEHIAVIYPNNDPGSAGIVRCWDAIAAASPSALFIRNLPRPTFLAMMRDAAVLVGNSSSGIIEAASYGTPVIDIGTRQAGRERGSNVSSVPMNERRIRSAARYIWNDGRPRRCRARNLYAGARTGQRIASELVRVDLARHVRKLIDW